jgi:molybdopterin-guanine dinucleotide biosynthesis protein A
VCVVAFDMPFITVQALALLHTAAQGHQAAAFEVSGELEPLPSWLHTGLGPAWTAGLSSQPSLRALLNNASFVRVGEEQLRTVDPGCQTVVSINTEADCRRWKVE